MYSHRIQWYLRITGVFVLLATLWPATALAADTTYSLTTSPVSMSLVIHPGTSDTRTLQLMNNSSQAVKITMKLNVFSPSGTSGEANITAPEPGDPAATWVQFSPSSFIAKPGVWSNVKMTISLPKTATLGYYYAVLFEPETSDAPAKNATFKGTNAILVLVDTQSGDEKRDSSLRDFTVSQDLYEYLPATFSVHLRNNGNIYLAPLGSVYISRKTDGTDSLGVLDVNPHQGNILPRSDRTFEVKWTDGFPVFEDKTVNGQKVYDKAGKPVQQLSWSFARLSRIRFGKYYAKVTLVYSDGKRVIPLTAVVSFWVIPWKLIGLTLATIALVTIGVLTIGRFIVKTIRGPKVYRL